MTSAKRRSVPQRTSTSCTTTCQNPLPGHLPPYPFLCEVDPVQGCVVLRIAPQGLHPRPLSSLFSSDPDHSINGINLTPSCSLPEPIRTVTGRALLVTRACALVTRRALPVTVRIGSGSEHEGVRLMPLIE